MKTILMIDDDLATLEVINESLRSHFRTRIATRGGKGLELARLSPAPDLVLLDLELPDMNGYQVCSALKHDATTADIPVIFLSSHSDIADITRGLELGAVDYVPKPVAPPILLARVRTQLRLREAQTSGLGLSSKARPGAASEATQSLRAHRPASRIAATISFCQDSRRLRLTWPWAFFSAFFSASSRIRTPSATIAICAGWGRPSLRTTCGN